MHNFSEVLVGKSKVFPLFGVGVSPNQDAVVFLKVKNPGDAITVIPQIKIFERQYNMSVVKEYQDSPITFAKNETKDVSLTMPKLDTPESYLAEVKFYQNNQQVSGIEYFRWVVEGGSGKILYIKADKDYYKAGDSINLTVESIGPADFSNLGTGKLEVDVYDKDGNFVAKTIKDVPLNADLFTSTITIPVKKDLVNPVIKASLTKDGKVLDKNNIKLPLFSQQAKDLEKKISNQEFIFKFLLFLIPLLIIFIAGIAVFLNSRFKSKRKNEK